MNYNEIRKIYTHLRAKSKSIIAIYMFAIYKIVSTSRLCKHAINWWFIDWFAFQEEVLNDIHVPYDMLNF